nr:hypothetical protein [Cupriavidus campinensis]
MAFYQLEPWGSHYDDLRAGTIASMVANVHRNPKAAPEPFRALDFCPWNEYSGDGRATEPILLDDPDAQADLIERVMFPKRS